MNRRVAPHAGAWIEIDEGRNDVLRQVRACRLSVGKFTR